MIARLNRTPHATADAEGRKSYMRFLPPLLAAVAAALVFFAGVTTGHISMDDWGYIYGCPFVRDGLSAANVAAAFSQFGYDAFWMPLTFISYMADISFFGGGWAVHHAVCVAIHAANAALAFVLLKRLASVFAPEASPRETALACLAAALFWALHPMRAEAVVYIAARKDLLWTFFALLGLIAWIGHIRRGGGMSLALATACCVLACLSKPTAVCFPFLALALEWAALGRFPRRLWRYAPMMATAVLVGAITLYCQSNPIDHERLDVFGEPLWWRVLNAAVASGMYLWHVVAPGGIRFDYRAVFGGCPLDCAFALSVLGLVLALFAVSLRFAGSRLRAALWLAAAWAVFSIGPVSGVLGTVNGDHAYADRYTYTDSQGATKTIEPATIQFGGRSDVSMPTMFYYVLIRTKRGNTGKALKDCAASELQCAAFVRPHTNDMKGVSVSSADLMSVTDLEALTGVTYFPNVPNAPKSTLVASDWGL